MSQQADSSGDELPLIAECTTQKRAVELVTAARCLLEEALAVLRAGGYYDPGLALNAIVQSVNADAVRQMQKGEG